MRRTAVVATALSLMAVPAGAADWPASMAAYTPKKSVRATLDVELVMNGSERVTRPRSPVRYSFTRHEVLRAKIDLVGGAPSPFDPLEDPEGKRFMAGASHLASVPVGGGDQMINPSTGVVSAARSGAASKGSPNAATAAELVQSSGIEAKVAECAKLKGTAEQQACMLSAAMAMKSQVDSRCQDPDPAKRPTGLCGGGRGQNASPGVAPVAPVVPGSGPGTTPPGAAEQARARAFSESLRSGGTGNDRYRTFTAVGCKMEGTFAHDENGMTETDWGAIVPYTHTVRNTANLVESPWCKAHLVIGRDGTVSLDLVVGIGATLPAHRVHRATSSVSENVTVRVGLWTNMTFPQKFIQDRIEALDRFTLTRQFHGEPQGMGGLWGSGRPGGGDNFFAESTTVMTIGFKMD